MSGLTIHYLGLLESLESKLSKLENPNVSLDDIISMLGDDPIPSKGSKESKEFYRKRLRLHAIRSYRNMSEKFKSIANKEQGEVKRTHRKSHRDCLDIIESI